MKIEKNQLSILNKMLAQHIWVNGVLIPFWNVEKILANYTRPLMVHNEASDYQCSLMGSGTCILYKNKYFLLCCKHQLENVLQGRPYENVGLLDKDGKEFCTSCGIRYFNEGNEAELQDLVLFDFTQPCLSRPIMRNHFFKVTDRLKETISDEVIAFSVVGYPSHEQQYDLAESNHLGLVKVSVTCVLAGLQEQPNDPAVLRIKPKLPLEYTPDGMSGGAAFLIRMKDSEFHANLAGIVVRGGTHDFYILKIDFILDQIDRLFLLEKSTSI